MKLPSLSLGLALLLSPALQAASPTPVGPESPANPKDPTKLAPLAATPTPSAAQFTPTPAPSATQRHADIRDLVFSRLSVPNLSVSALGIGAPSVAAPALPAPAAKSSPAPTAQAGTDFLAARDSGSTSVSGHTIDPASRKMATDPFQVSIEHLTRRDSLLDVLERAINPLPTGEGPFSSSTGLSALPYAFTAPGSR